MPTEDELDNEQEDCVVRNSEEEYVLLLEAMKLGEQKAEQKVQRRNQRLMKLNMAALTIQRTFRQASKRAPKLLSSLVQTLPTGCKRIDFLQKLEATEKEEFVSMFGPAFEEAKEKNPNDTSLTPLPSNGGRNVSASATSLQGAQDVGTTPGCSVP